MARAVRFAAPNIVAARLRTAWRRIGRAPRGESAPAFTAPSVVFAFAAFVTVLVLMPFDERISLAMAAEPEGVRAFLRVATDVGLVRWYLYPAAALVLALLFLTAESLPRRQRHRIHVVAGHGTFLFCAVALAGIVTNILKVFFGRARPALLDEHGSFAFQLVRFGDEFASFPSGHSTTMGAVTAATMIWFPAIRLPLLLAGSCFALSRIVVEAHFPSDVVAGFTIGFLTATLLGRALAARRLIYRFRRNGDGWKGLLPVRAGAL